MKTLQRTTSDNSYVTDISSDHSWTIVYLKKKWKIKIKKCKQQNPQRVMS